MTMRYRLLGGTDLSVSVIGLGTWQYGGEWGITYTEGDVALIVDKAEELGVNLIDTAECYGDHLSERMIGAAIQKKRHRWIVATKFGHTFRGFMDRTRQYTPKKVVLQLEASLKALRTDYIDIYQCHSPTDEEFAAAGLWETLHKEVEKGKILHLGVSISPNTNIRQTDAATRVSARVIQVAYNRLDREPEDGVFQSCQKQHIGVLARVPLASGFLSGKYKPGQRFDAADVRSTQDQEKVQKKLLEVEEITQNEVPPGIPMAQWAIAWCLKHPAVTAAIPGSKSPEQLHMNVKAVELLDGFHPLDAASPME